MFCYKFRINFCFVLCVIVRVYFGNSVEIPPGNWLLLPEKACVNDNCCEDLPEMPNGTACLPINRTTVPVYYTETATEKVLVFLKFTGIKNFPPNLFQGKYIFCLYVDDYSVTVDRNILEGVDALEFFLVMKSSTKVVPDFSFVKDSVRTIFITSSSLTSLEGKNLQNLTLVDSFNFTDNRIRFIDPDVFKGTENVKTLSIAYNLLTFIPENLFDPMKKLVRLFAEKNNLLHVNNLFSITRPKIIGLGGNNITDIGWASQINFMNYQKTIPFKLSRCNESNDAIHVADFQPLSTIEILGLTYNSIKEPSESIFQCYRGRMDGIEIIYVPQIMVVELSNNSLRHLTFLLRFLRIFDLRADRNQIQYLTDEDFKYTSGLTALSLHENEIKRIDTDTFKPIATSLMFLHLKYNLIPSLNGSIRHLRQLKVLQISDNLIESFAVDEFSGLDQLQNVYLEHNRLKSIDPLQQITYLDYVNISYNNIESITPNLLPHSLRLMQLAGNPFKHNCLFNLFLRRLNTSAIASDIHAYSKPDFDFNAPKHSNSQDWCSYECIDYGNVSYIFVDCSSQNLVAVPQFLANNVTEVEMSAGFWLPLVQHENWKYYIGHVHSIFQIKDEIAGINLANNSLESLEEALFPPNLIELYLSDNKLQRLPESVFENQPNLKKVTLSGNPWKCDCETLNFKRWLNSEKYKIKDIDNVRCGIIDDEASHLNGRVIWNLTALDLCPTRTAL